MWTFLIKLIFICKHHISCRLDSAATTKKKVPSSSLTFIESTNNLISFCSAPSNRHSTYNQQRHSMLHECGTASKEARQQNDDRYGNQYVDTDVIWINVEDSNPLLEARLHSYPQREGKQAETDELKKKKKEKIKLFFFMSRVASLRATKRRMEWVKNLMLVELNSGKQQKKKSSRMLMTNWIFYSLPIHDTVCRLPLTQSLIWAGKLSRKEIFLLHFSDDFWEF